MGKITSLEQPQSNISEAYRTIRTGIEFSNLDKNLKVICITSSKKDEGKTTVLCNLGVNFAKIDKKVLLIDGDLRNPSVNKLFNTKNAQGLMDILLGRKTFEECIKQTKQENLYVLTGGTIPPNPAEVLSSKKMGQFIKYFDSVNFIANNFISYKFKVINLMDYLEVIKQVKFEEVEERLKNHLKEEYCSISIVEPK